MGIDIWQCGDKCYLECDDNFSQKFSGYLNPRNFRDFFKDFKQREMPAGTYYRAITHDLTWVEEYIW